MKVISVPGVFSSLMRASLVFALLWVSPIAPAQEGLETAQQSSTAPVIYVVNFTADWCPNCKILDPALATALMQVDGMPMQAVTLDLTNADTANAAFDRVNGTVLAGVYGDYIGLTGLAVMVAADSGEKLGCATRVMDVGGIAATIRGAVETATAYPAGERPAPGFLCPPANKKRRL
ncbi:MAG: thioredoxin domain-containing protein [Pseudomonadota bacterium]